MCFCVMSFGNTWLTACLFCLSQPTFLLPLACHTLWLRASACTHVDMVMARVCNLHGFITFAASLSTTDVVETSRWTEEEMEVAKQGGHFVVSSCYSNVKHLHDVYSLLGCLDSREPIFSFGFPSTQDVYLLELLLLKDFYYLTLQKQ